MERVVVVGASLAGLHAAEALRAGGFEGTLTMVGDEPHLPYDRPPLSKQVLAGMQTTEDTQLRGGPALDAQWEHGVGATSLDRSARAVTLADGRALPYDGLVIATGAAARRLPGTEGFSNVCELRTAEDANILRGLIDRGARHVTVVGAGFIGCEVAATCRGRGLDVTIVEPLPAPLARVLGPEVGRVMADLHEEHGVDVRLGIGVEGFDGETVGDGDGDGRALCTAVRLADGSVVETDVAVVGIGVVPNIGWLEGSGLTLDNGVVCDETTLAAPGVVAAGDVARWPNPTYDGELMRVEHWEHAINMGVHAGRRLLAGDGPGEPFATVPWFWSDQYDRKIQLAGRVQPDDEVAVVAGSYAERRFCVLYGRGGQVSAVLAMNMPARVVRYRRQLAEGLGWADALAAAAEST